LTISNELFEAADSLFAFPPDPCCALIDLYDIAKRGVYVDLKVLGVNYWV
jgi:hypothetical protein